MRAKLQSQIPALRERESAGLLAHWYASRRYLVEKERDVPRIIVRLDFEKIPCSLVVKVRLLPPITSAR